MVRCTGVASRYFIVHAVQQTAGDIKVVIMGLYAVVEVNNSKQMEVELVQ